MLIPIRVKGPNQPIFFLPGAPGNLGWLIELATLLGKEYSIYGVEPIGLKHWEKRHQSIETMASAYIKEIKTVQPHGPYCLAGYSFGGTVAYEMATQLLAQNEMVSDIILLDAYAPCSKTIKNLNLPNYFPWLLIGNMLGAFWKLPKPFEPTELAALEPETYTGYIADRLGKQAQTLLPSANVISLIENSVNLMLQAETLIEAYQPKPYQGDSNILLFQAQLGFIQAENKYLLQNHANSEYEAFHGWSELFNRPIAHFEVPGDHFELVSMPSLQIVAERLKAYFSHAIATADISKADQSTSDDMSKMNIITQLRALAARYLKIDADKLANDKSINHYGISSLSSVLLAQAINKTFDLELEFETILDNFTFNQLADLVMNHKHQHQTGITHVG